MIDSSEPWIGRREFNSFDQLRYDAEELLKLAEHPTSQQSFLSVQLSRTALLLQIVSLEALINRVMDTFLPAHLRPFFAEREKQLSVEDKWYLTPLLVAGRSFDRSTAPWSHLVELVRLRNELVHPKPDRPCYVRFLGHGNFANLDWKQVPAGAGIQEKDVVYRQTLLPRNPAAIHPEHVRGRVCQVVEK